MTCRAVRRRLSPYLDSRLETTARRRIEAHLADCPRCADEFARLKAYRERMVSLNRRPAPEGFLEAVRRRLAAESRHEEKPSFTERIRRALSPLPYRLPIAAAGVIALVLAITFNLQHRYEQRPPAPDLSKQTPAITEKQFREKDHVDIDDDMQLASRDGSHDVGTRAMAPGDSSTDDVKTKAVITEKRPIEIAIVIATEDGVRGMATMRAEESAPAYEAEATKEKSPSIALDKRERRQSGLSEMAKQSDTVKSDRPANEAVKKVDKTSAEDATERITTIAKALRGTVLRVDRATWNREPQSLIIEIPPRNYPMFLDRLNEIGRVKPAGKPTYGDDRKTLTLRIHLKRVK